MAMQRKKWLLCILAVVLFVVMALTGCSDNSGNAENENVVNNTQDGNNQAEVSNFNPTELPIVNEKVTYKITAVKNVNARKPYNEMVVFKNLEEKTNVHIDWTTTEASVWGEKKNLLFASSDLPDAFYGNGVLTNDEVVAYGSQGILIPLEEMIEKYAPNLNKIFEENPEYKKGIIAPDGHIYALPRINLPPFPNAGDALYINQEWLDALQLQVPETTEQFYQVLKAFKEDDPNGNGQADEIPLSFRYNQSNEGMFSLSGSFGVVDNAETHSYVDNGEVKFAPVQPEYKQFLEYFHKLYAEGLIDQESFTQDGKVYSAKNQNKETGAAVVYNATSFSSDVLNSGYTPVPPLKGPDGHQLWNFNPAIGLNSQGAFAITTEAQNPEILMRWIDEHYDPLTSYAMSVGPIGINVKLNEDGMYEKLPIPEGMTASEFRHSEAPGSGSVSAGNAELLKKKVLGAGEIEKKAATELYLPFLNKDMMYPKMLFAKEDVDRMTVLKTDMFTYVETTIPKFIIEGVTDSSWNDYIEQLNQMGLEELIGIYQRNYNRYSK